MRVMLNLLFQVLYSQYGDYSAYLLLCEQYQYPQLHFFIIIIIAISEMPTLASAAIKTAARRIAWGKSTNAGQTCIAPDYVIVHEKVKTEFVNELARAWDSFYPNGAENSTDLVRIVSKTHYNRLVTPMDEALSSGARPV